MSKVDVPPLKPFDRMTFREQCTASLIPCTDWKKEHLFTVTHWFRQLLGLVAGVICGSYKFTGIFSILGFLIISSFIVVLFSTKFHSIKVEEDTEPQEVVKEGFLPSFGLFLLTWVLFFNL
eukprot:TRINITY_DN22813_c0_g1_i1.p1 TRINITY_DN22813_c0_g1~~TRINITY_DN22813_c0_g1_i1.p1  ORF type:complete len:121 (+),score=12.28 TRINITY_DN22813_c0_g1_i1:54-416(+)